MKFLAFITITLLSFASASWVYAGDSMSAIGKDIGSVMNSEAAVSFDSAVTSIRPGTMLYNSEGTRIGAIRALTRHETEIKTVWVGTARYDDGVVALIDGVATFTPKT